MSRLPGRGRRDGQVIDGQRAVDADERHRRRERGGQGRGRFAVGFVGDENARGTVREEGDDLPRGGEGVERHEDRARPQRADEGLDVLGAVADQAGNPVASDAGAGQDLAEPGRADVEVAP